MSEAKIRGVHVQILDKLLMDAGTLLEGSQNRITQLIEEPLSIKAQHRLLSVVHDYLEHGMAKVTIAREGLGEWKEERGDGKQ